MTTALITGASGFIGGHLAHALVQRGVSVRCLVRRSSKLDDLPRDQVELAYGDMRDSAALAETVRGTDVVYHLAAMTSALRVAHMMAVNAGGSESLAAACAAQPQPPVLVCTSSIAASGPIPLGNIRTEQDPPAPISNYGRSKLAGEEACRKYAGRVPTTVVRAAIVFGPRNRELLPVFQTLRRFRFHASAGFQSPPLSFVYIDHLVNLLIRCADSAPRLPAPEDHSANLGQGIYFAAAEEHPTYADFGRLLRPLLDRPFAPIISLPSFMAYAVAGLNQGVMRLRGKPDVFNTDKIREATASSWACSGAAAQRDLDIGPEYTLEERLSETIAWYRKEGWL